jgi:hypothetical protein
MIKRLILSIVFYLAFHAAAIAAPVPDTGQAKCYDLENEIPCPEPGEQFYGQDANYDITPRSYADLGNGIVRDNVTGLEWQQATAPGTYTWQQAFDYSQYLSFASHTDWRLPTIKELSTLLDKSMLGLGPTIDQTAFPGTMELYYWSSTSAGGESPDSSWGVDFMSSYIGTASKTDSKYVRAVRSGLPIINNFIDNGDGTVTDKATGLMWQQAAASGTYNWEPALIYCEGLTLAGYSDWRLPNNNELQSITDYSISDPAIDTLFFPDMVGQDYWSSSPDPSLKLNPHDSFNYMQAFYVDFESGRVGSIISVGTIVNFNVRAVRSSQCADSDLDGICDDGDSNETVVGNPCAGGDTENCDDNCPGISNSDQADADADGVGDVCDDLDVPAECRIEYWGGKNGIILTTETEITEQAANDFTLSYKDQSAGCEGVCCSAYESYYYPDPWGSECSSVSIEMDVCLDGSWDESLWFPNDDWGMCGGWHISGQWGVYCDDDEDGIFRGDNCPQDYNPAQEDCDENGVGSACEVWVDSDSDTVLDGCDNCPTIFNPHQYDADGDGEGDECDDDIPPVIFDVITSQGPSYDYIPLENWMVFSVPQEMIIWSAADPDAPTETGEEWTWTYAVARSLFTYRVAGETTWTEEVELLLEGGATGYLGQWKWVSLAVLIAEDGFYDIKLISEDAAGNRGEVIYYITINKTDSDGDSIPDDVDNCPDNCNSQQLDADNDGIGDVCDPDDGCFSCGNGPICEIEC